MSFQQALLPLTIILALVSLAMPSDTGAFAICCCAALAMSMTRFARAIDVRRFRDAGIHAALMATFSYGLYTVIHP